MTEFMAILIAETDKARLFRVVDREVWIPRSQITNIVKFMPDKNGHRECRVTVEEWFASKENL